MAKKKNFSSLQQLLKILRKSGLKAVQQQETLLVIMDGEGVSHAHIQEILDASQSSVSKNVKKLKKLGLIKVFSDGLTTSNHLTDDGLRLKKKVSKFLKSK